MNVVVAGGGTAGHVFPAIATAGRLADEHGARVEFVGTASGLEARLVAEAGFPFHAIDARPLVRSLSFRALHGPWSAVRSVGQCRPIVAEADAVLGMGGYVSAPAALAAALARRPLVLHEQNAVPGLANRVLARAARRVALSFPEAARGLPRRVHAEVTGNPVRETILDVADRRTELAGEARRELGLDEARRTVVVFGGSQGALHLNRTVVGAARILADRDDLQVVLLTGPAHHEAIAAELAGGHELLVRAVPFLERMELAYAVADLVVARAGATTIAEVTVCGLPALLVPYPYATARHQEANARALQRVGAASLLFDEDLSAEVFAERVTELVDHGERLAAMAERAGAWARRDAASALARVVAEAAEGAR